MQKLSNFTGSARHGWEKMTPSAFGMGRGPPPQHPDGGMPTNNGMKTRGGHMPPPMSINPALDTQVTVSFNVPFASNLAGPEQEDIVHASPNAANRWLLPVGTPDGIPTHRLPVHTRNVDYLRQLCKSLSETSHGRLEASVTSSEAKPMPNQRAPRKGLITNVCVTGDGDLVYKMRAKILSETPIQLRCATVFIDAKFVLDPSTGTPRQAPLDHLNKIAIFTGCDIFLLKSKQADSINLSGNHVNGTDQTLESRYRIAIYGDPESSEHAKMRVLIMIDQILKRAIDVMKLEHSLHKIICGRTRKNIRWIEAATKTAIYFPPPFPRIYGYVPPGAHRRGEDEIFITGETQDAINQAKRRIAELVTNTKCYVKEVSISPSKIDSIILDRLDKVRKVMELNGTYVMFPPLGSQRNRIHVQGLETVQLERTVREIMALAGQFYHASWWIVQLDNAFVQHIPEPADIRAMLSDVCTNSGAEMSFEKFQFQINGSDDAVKDAMVVINQIPFVSRSQYNMRVKIELASEHKEFVSGKKNGKINKIMGQSNVQILFDGFNDYNFYIDVAGGQYEAVKNGLDLVEQEMPASISFHVPDQYHKRIIGIGGQHIQRIMKKYSVFVKFSNAMDRGGIGKDEDDMKVDNVICRTPARNAQSLDLVKTEIMDMVEKVHAEFVSETVIINRLYHRELIARMAKIEELEKKWNCKIDFPSTETASDVVTISGAEYQVPQALDEFLGMVPEEHELDVPSNPQLKAFYGTDEFEREVREKLKTQYEVNLLMPDHNVSEKEDTDTMILAYTRNNAGGLKDAIEFLVSCLVPHGLDAEAVKGAIPRPKSDMFEETLPFFESKLLQRTHPANGSTDSPTRSTFGEEIHERGSFLDKLRKPGSMTSLLSFTGQRKNQSASSTSLFKHASSNASKASLVSMESRDSGYRNPWNDSGLHLNHTPGSLLNDDDSTYGSNGWPSRFDMKPFGAALPGDSTPKHGGSVMGNSVYGGSAISLHDVRSNFDGSLVTPIGTTSNGRPTTSHSFNSAVNGMGTNNNNNNHNNNTHVHPPGPIGPPR